MPKNELYIGFFKDKDLDIPNGYFISDQPKKPSKKRQKTGSSKKHDPKISVDFANAQESFFDQMHAFMDVLPASAILMPTLKSIWLKRIENAGQRFCREERTKERI